MRQKELKQLQLPKFSIVPGGNGLRMLLMLVFFCFGQKISAQNMSISNNGAAPDSSAMLDVQSTDKGFLMPRLTKAQRELIPAPADGLMVFQTDGIKGMYLFNATDLSWYHVMDSVQIKAFIDSLTTRGIDSVLSYGNDAAQGSIYNLDTLSIGAAIANFMMQVSDTTSNLTVDGNYGSGMLITSKFNSRIYFENLSHSDSNRLMNLWFDDETLGFGSLTDNGQSWLKPTILNMTTGGNVAINSSPSPISKLFIYRAAADSSEFGPGHSNIYGYRDGLGSSTAGGNGWGPNGVDAAVKGFSYWGNAYTAGVAGHNFMDFANSAGVIGTDYDGTIWGALAFNDGTHDYGIYSDNDAYLGGYLSINSPQDSMHRIIAVREATAATNDYGPGYTSIYGYRGGGGTAANGGTGWQIDSVDAAVKGYSFWGNNYTAGVAGYNYNDYGPSGGVIGSNAFANYWGALGYYDGTSQFGVYTPSNVYLGGNVGIGTTSPTEKLHVSGNVFVDGDAIIPSTNGYYYSTAKTLYKSVSAAAFTSIQGAVGGFTSGNARWLVSGTAGLDGFMYAPVDLPHGATVTQLTFYVFDNDAVYEVYGELYRQTFGSSIVSLVASTSPTGLLSIPGTTSIASGVVSHLVDNSSYSYYVRFNTKQNNSNLRVYGARITYTVDKVD